MCAQKFCVLIFYLLWCNLGLLLIVCSYVWFILTTSNNVNEARPFLNGSDFVICGRGKEYTDEKEKKERKSIGKVQCINVVDQLFHPLMPISICSNLISSIFTNLIMSGVRVKHRSTANQPMDMVTMGSNVERGLKWVIQFTYIPIFRPPRLWMSASWRSVTVSTLIRKTG